MTTEPHATVPLAPQLMEISMPDLRPSLDFARKLQSALTVDEIGASYVAAVRDVIFARGRGIYRLDPQTNGFVDQAADVPSPLLTEYATVGMDEDPVLDAAISAGRPVASSDRAVASSWSASRAQQILSQFGFAHSLKAPLVVGDVIWGSIHFTRFTTDPPFSSRDRVAAALLVDHLGAALTRAVRHEQVSWRAGSLQAALNCVAQPVVVTDRFGNHVLTNTAAQTEAVSGRQILEIISPSIQDASDLIHHEGRRVVTTQLDTPDPASLSVRSVAVPRYGATVSVVFTRSDTPQAGLPDLAVLSKREQEIALLVSEGLSTKQIASRAFITENTVKQHLKRIFAKLGVSSRAEMVHAMWAAAKAESVEGTPR